MIRIFRPLAIIAAVCYTLLFPGLVFAQTIHQKPKGVPAGSFLVFPILDLSYRTDDNIYAEEKNKTSDKIVGVKGGLAASSDWNNHSLTIQSLVEAGNYSKKTKENFVDATVSLGGRIDVVKDVNLAMDAGYASMHEDRGSPNDLYGLEPTKYNQIFADAGFNHQVSALRLNLYLRMDKFSYGDTPTSALINVDQKGRNRTNSDGAVRLGYVIEDLFTAFVQGKYFGRDYQRKDKLKYGYDRTSSGYEFTVGVQREFSEVSKIELLAGTRKQIYKDVDLPNISGPQVSGLYLWTPSEMTSMTLYVNRSIEETIMAKTSGYFTTNYGIMLDQELIGGFLLKLGYNGSAMDYKGIKRKDATSAASASLYWFMNDYIYLGATFDYKDRKSDAVGYDFKRSVAKIILGGRI